MTNYYGFSTTEEVQYDKQGLPVGTYKAFAVGEEPDEKGRGVIVEYEVLDGQHKGKKGKVWYLSTHDNPTVANIARQQLKRIADATGRPVTPTAPIKGRTLTLIVAEQKNDNTRTEIKKYLPENHISEDMPL
jgi:ribosomal protein L24